MASIDKRSNGKYLARWREYTGAPQKSKQFTRKLDAERWLIKVQHDLLSGTYVAPEAGKTTLEAYFQLWSARMEPTWRKATFASVKNTFEHHVIPAIGGRPIGSIRRGDVEAFAATLKLAPSTVALVVLQLGQMFRAAIEDGLLVRDPTSRARLPRAEASKAQPVPMVTVQKIEAALPDWMKVAVPLGVAVGLRQGEASGLTVDRVQFLRRTLLVDRQLLCRNVPEPVLAPPKTASSVRTIPLASQPLTALSRHLELHPADPSDFVLRSPAGKPLDSDTFGHQWRRAVKAAGAPGLRFHDLRHTFASMLLSRGVSVKAVAEWLGHASAVTTLNTYAHVMPADEDVARSVLDDALAPPAERDGAQAGSA